MPPVWGGNYVPPPNSPFFYFFRPFFLVVHAADSARICGQKTSALFMRMFMFRACFKTSRINKAAPVFNARPFCFIRRQTRLRLTPPALRATSPFRRGFSADRKHSAERPHNPRSCRIINDRFFCASPSMPPPSLRTPAHFVT